MSYNLVMKSLILVKLDLINIYGTDVIIILCA